MSLPSKSDKLRIIQGGNATVLPKIEDQPYYEVELRFDLEGSLHLFDSRSGMPIELSRSVKFTLPAGSLATEEAVGFGT